MRDTLLQRAAAALLVVLLGACSGSAASAPPSAESSPSAAPSATAMSEDVVGDVDVDGGRTMHYVCVGPTGTGHPTVIFETGLTGDLRQWTDVLQAIQGRYRACAYDRAGNGGSPPAEVGRTTKDQVADLHALLAAADVAPPYVLVGFSIGGWNVIVYNDEYPDEVVGAVMVDVRPPSASGRWLAELPPPASDEPEIFAIIREESTTFEEDPTQNSEGLLLAESAAQALATDGFGDKPLAVLAASDTSIVSDGLDADLGARFVAIWWELQEGLAGLSTAGELVKVDGTGHDMPFERPDAIADAIDAILGE